MKNHGARQLTSRFLKGNKGQPGLDILGVDEAIEKSGPGGIQTGMSEKVQEPLVNVKSGLREELPKTLKDFSLRNPVMMMTGEIGFGHDQIRDEDRSTVDLHLLEELPSGTGQGLRLPGEQANNHRSIQTNSRLSHDSRPVLS